MACAHRFVENSQMSDALNHAFSHEPHLRMVANAIREEWREETESIAGEAFLARRRDRTLVDELCESMARGDRLNIRCFNVRASGVVVEVDEDLISLRNAGPGRVDVHYWPGLPLIMQVTEPAAVDGRVSGLASGGFHGRLLECERSGDEYALSIIGEAEALDGKIEVAADYVTTISRLGARFTVPVAAVLAISPRL